MVPNQNYEVLASILFYIISKIISYISEGYREMYKNSALTSIPENDVEGEEVLGRKWVPKKKHEVLKAKYKCLKKLFQIYDASVIGMLPTAESETVEENETKCNRRRKRSHRTKTDACAGTTELSNGDNSYSDLENSVATAIIRDLKIDQSCISTQVVPKIDQYAETNQFDEDLCEKELRHETLKENIKQMEYPTNNLPHPLPYLITNKRRKLTRFQSFVQRILGIRRDTYCMPNQQIYASSDSMAQRRRRKGMRFRRLRKPKKVKSDSALNDMKSPIILSYVQSVQRHCLQESTPRQCPIVGCNMMTYGIINYNDHLNICHFKDRKFICHYCHEGFETDYERLLHENEHIGISKLTTNVSNLSTIRQTCQIASNTQTEPEITVPDEKLKKIVSFFDKLSDPDQILLEIKKGRRSEINFRQDNETSEGVSACSGNTRTISCCNIMRKEKTNSSDSDTTSKRCPLPAVTCHFCGENFHYRRQLSLHVDLEHRMHNKFSKFHSCAGIINRPQVDMTTQNGRIDIQSQYTTNSIKSVTTESTLTDNLTRDKSELSCDPSTNIIYYTSDSLLESVRKPSVVDSLIKKVRSYKWEPGTKIIRV